MSAKVFCDQLLSIENKVVIFSLKQCPYCIKAINAFKELNVPSDKLIIQQLDDMQNADEIKSYMRVITSASSLPRVFINGQFIGGGDDTVKALKDGTLKKKLIDAHILN